MRRKGRKLAEVYYRVVIAVGRWHPALLWALGDHVAPASESSPPPRA